MMRSHNINMTTTVSKDKLLETLKTNLENHARIVQEAREGYVRRARRALEDRLAQILEGKTVALSFSLQPPLDYSKVYRNTIRMLEWNENGQITLSADEFSQLVLDQWDWSQHFYASNSVYSNTAQQIQQDQAVGEADEEI